MPEVTDEEVEAVARALAREAHFNDQPVDEFVDDAWPAFLDQARAAIAAYNATEGQVRMREDAERYRWLRVHSWVDLSPSTPAIEFGAGFDQTCPEVLDNAIDAARAAEGKK